MKGYYISKNCIISDHIEKIYRSKYKNVKFISVFEFMSLDEKYTFNGNIAFDELPFNCLNAVIDTDPFIEFGETLLERILKVSNNGCWIGIIFEQKYTQIDKDLCAVIVKDKFYNIGGKVI